MNKLQLPGTLHHFKLFPMSLLSVKIMLLTSFSGKNQTVFFQAPDFFTKSISYVNLILTCLSWLWRHVACNDLYPFRQRGSLLHCTTTETNAQTRILPLRLPLYGYVVVMIFIEINKKTIDPSAFRSSLTEFVVPKSIAKYAARSVFCSVALLFSRLVHCRHRVLELANNVTSHNNSWYATISLKNQRFEGKRRPQERPIERLSS